MKEKIEITPTQFSKAFAAAIGAVTMKNPARVLIYNDLAEVGATCGAILFREDK